ncbi:phasin family protein [Alloalcanivorax xenomutans]|uniref:phasin family protein n=1 Tax=Alloalcanivorax xenomutans TaxID=1094342 RepID=UPI0017DA42F9|nr:phasin family protein [Alloalcanivorax xenomutans]MBA4723468.1 phasin family protein [Alcanivorax sp.]
MSDQPKDNNQDKKDERSPLRTLTGASRDLRKYTHQIWLAGLGAFARAEEEGSGFFDALVEAGRQVEKHTREKAPRVEDIKERVRHHTGETMDRMEKAFDDRLSKALSRLGIPNKREVEALQRRVQELTDALERMEDEESEPESKPRDPE